MEDILQCQSGLLESGSMIWGVGAKDPEVYVDAAQKILPHGWVLLLQTEITPNRLDEAAGNLKNKASSDNLKISVLPNVKISNKIGISIFPKKVYQNGIASMPMEFTTTLNSLIEDHPPPSLLIIEDEGNEGDILEGAERILRSVRSKILCKVKQDDKNIERISNIFNKYGYHVFDASTEKNIPEDVKFNEIQFKKTPLYTLAIPQERKHT